MVRRIRAIEASVCPTEHEAAFVERDLIGGTVLGLIGALMAIPVAAGLKVIFAERLQARDAADPDPGPAPGPGPDPVDSA